MNIIKKKKFKGKNIDVVDFETNLTGLRIKHEMIEQGNAVAVLALQKDARKCGCSISITKR